VPTLPAAVFATLAEVWCSGTSAIAECDVTTRQGRRHIGLRCERTDGVLLVTFSDASGQRSAQRMLSEREAQLRLVLETIFDGVTVIDERGAIIAVNAAMTRMFGYTADAMSGMTLQNLIPGLAESDSGRPRLLYDSDHRLIGTARQLEGHRQDGSIVPVELSVCEGDRGGMHLFVGVVHDISDRRRAEAEIRRSGDLLRQVIDAVPDLITLKDEQLHCIMVNRVSEMFGHSAEDVIGRRFDEFLPTAEAQHLSAQDAQVLKDGKAQDETGSLTIPSSGRSGWFRMQRRRVMIDGKPHVLGISSDITELHDALAAAEQARKDIETLHQAQSVFMASLSHEIRTPLNGILGMSELLLKTGLSAEQEEQVHTLHRAGEALLVLLNDILDYTKIEAGRLEIEAIPFDLALVIYDVVELFRTRLSTNDVELVIDIAPGLPRQVVGDPGRLRQIVSNLVSNALKFTRSGYVLVEVRRTMQETDGRWRYTVAVEDTGSGIPATAQARLFSPFQQADASVSRRYGGTGLGLAISRRLVELMDGTIGVDSEPDRGSRFTVTVPFLTHGHTSTTMAAMPPPGTTVLIVDHHALTRQIIGSILVEAGVATTLVESAGEALAVLAQAADAGRPFSLALIEADLPGMDGESLGQAIRADPAYAATRLVMLTHAPKRGDAANCSKVGFSGFLVKPVRGEVLLAALATVLQRADRGDPTLVTRHTVGEHQRRQAAENRQPLPRLHVLLVEDNHINQKVISSMLESLGADVALAGDGAAALERLRDDRFDIILLDCHMPGMDGFQAVTAIRRHERDENDGRHQIVIALTGDAQAEDRDRCLKAGMDDHLAKPVSEDDLYITLERWCSHA
jgi:PAS domain S-box-containing protein